MKNRKSALRKAVMVAMLAGAITTTGGVKAEENFDFYNHVMRFLEDKSDDESYEKLGKAFEKLPEEQMKALFRIWFSADNSDGISQSVMSIAHKLKEKEQLRFEEVVEMLWNSVTDELDRRIDSEASLKKDKAELQDDLNKAIKVSTDLMNQLGTAKEARDKAQAEVERLSQAVDSLGRLTESAKRELTEKLAEIDQLTQDKAKADADLEAANANITTLQEELVDVKADVDKLSEEKAAADQALAEANARVSNLEQEIVAANNRVADLEAQLAEKTAELDMVKADKAELEAKVKELQSLLEQKDHNNADLQAEIKRLKQELADKFKDLSQPRAKTPQASNSVAKQKASRPAAKPAGQLPSTGEDAANPFFTAAAVAIMTGAGLVTVMPKRQKD